MARLSAEKAVKVRADFVGTTVLKCVALSTSGLEQVGTLGIVTCSKITCQSNIPPTMVSMLPGGLNRQCQSDGGKELNVPSLKGIVDMY